MKAILLFVVFFLSVAFTSNTYEIEPNDWHMTANYVGATDSGNAVNGSIDSEDKDWFSWRVAPTNQTGIWNAKVSVTAEAHAPIKIVMFQRVWMNGEIAAVIHYGFAEGTSIHIDGMNIMYRGGVISDFLVLVLSETPTTYTLSCSS